MRFTEAQARLRDSILMILGGAMLIVLPIWLGWASRNGWFLGIPALVGSLLIINGIVVLTELPTIGKVIRVVFSYALMLGLATILIGPMIWMLLISLHPPKSPIPPLNETLPIVAVEVKDPAGKPIMIAGPDGRMVPKTVGKPDLHWENFDTVLNSPTLPVRRFFLNTVFVTVTVVFFQLLITSLCAYGLSRMRFRGRELVFYLFIGSMMFAGPVTQIPVYLMLKSFGWLDTYWALIVPGVSSAFSVFLLRQFFLQIPFELDEAARIDGAGEWTIYARVIMPLSKAALATAGAFTFFGVWTDFFGPLIYTNSTEMRTLEVGLSVFKNSYGGGNWPLQMAAALVVMTPLLLVFLFVQRFFTRGIMLGSIK
jgi:multiple sugar transport system permease protein